MKIDRLEFTKRFNKRYAALSTGKQNRVKKALHLASADINDQQLRFHELKGDYTGTQSISAGGDLRIHLELRQENGLTIATLHTVGTHGQLYG